MWLEIHCIRCVKFEFDDVQPLYIRKKILSEVGLSVYLMIVPIVTEVIYFTIIRYYTTVFLTKISFENKM